MLASKNALEPAALAFVGLADAAANGTYSVAAQLGLVTIAAVLASLYPGRDRPGRTRPPG